MTCVVGLLYLRLIRFSFGIPPQPKRVTQMSSSFPDYTNNTFDGSGRFISEARFRKVQQSSLTRMAQIKRIREKFRARVKTIFLFRQQLNCWQSLRVYQISGSFPDYTNKLWVRLLGM